MQNLINLLKKLNIPFSGTTIQSGKNKYHISPFQQISLSGIGPIFYINNQNQKIYTLLQRRFKDNFQWWFPGGYVEIPSAQSGFFLENFQKIKAATIEEFYQNSLTSHSWQKPWEDINNPKKLRQTLLKHQLEWPEEIDSNWQSAWQREVLEETGIDLDKFPQALTLDLKMTKTLMLGAEGDRLVNIDGKFCSLLGSLDAEPKTKPDHEIEELQWIDIETILFNEKQQQYVTANNLINPYVLAVLEESLFEIICHQITEISKTRNPITKQQISKFNTPQNIQSFLLAILPHNIDDLDLIKDFISWKFGELNITQNLCGKNGNKFYKLTLTICRFISSRNSFSSSDFITLNNLLKKEND